MFEVLLRYGVIMKANTISTFIIGTILFLFPVAHAMKSTPVKPVTDYKKQLITAIETGDYKTFSNTFRKHRLDINAEPALRSDLEHLAMQIKNEKQAELDKEKPREVTPVTSNQRVGHGAFHTLTLRDLMVGLPKVTLILADLAMATVTVVALLIACGRNKNSDPHLSLEYTPEVRKRARLASIVLLPTALGLHYLTDKVISGAFSKQYQLLKAIDALDDIISCIHSVK
jgi:hypothetical protein